MTGELFMYVIFLERASLSLQVIDNRQLCSIKRTLIHCVGQPFDPLIIFPTMLLLEPGVFKPSERELSKRTK